MLGEVYVIGSSAAIPTLQRSPSCQLLNLKNEMFMLDCGEGTQVRLMEYGLKSLKISKIFITHLHGDHVFGLPGLLSSMALQGRRDPLEIIGPKEIKTYIETSFIMSKAPPPFTITYTLVEGNKVTNLGESDQWYIKSVPLKHRIPTYGYVFQSKKGERHLLPEKYFALGVGYEYISQLKRGEDVVIGDKHIRCADVTSPGDPPVSFAYITDTDFMPAIVDELMEIDVVYHETTFLHKEKERARATLHTTALEAGKICQAANVKNLLMGHFSARYPDVRMFEKEASTIFTRNEAVIEGYVYEFNENGIIERGPINRTQRSVKSLRKD